MNSILDQVIQHPEVHYTLVQELAAKREQLDPEHNKPSVGISSAHIKNRLYFVQCMLGFISQ